MKFSIAQTTTALFFLLAMSPSSLLVLGECDATYSVNFQANYPNNVTVKCTMADMDLITRIIHSVVELDAISAKIATEVPEFHFIKERYGENAIIDDTGLLSAPLDVQDLIEHLTPQDLMEELYFEHGLINNNDGDSRKLAAAAQDEEQTHLIQPEEDEEEEQSELFTPTVEYASPMLPADPNHRRAQLMDCSLLAHCRSTWCCQVCGFCWRRRQRQLAASSSSQPSKNLRTRALTEEQQDDEEYLRKVEMHEQRVTAELLKKFRYMMRKDTIPCLGNFWELQVFFKLIR